MNPVVHLELHTRDLPGARSAFAELCGWPAELVDTGCGSYLAVGVGAGIGGGIVECPVPRPTWLPYVEVEQVALAVAGARELGATVLLGPREGPAGWRAVVSLPAGGELAFWQPKGSAS